MVSGQIYSDMSTYIVICGRQSHAREREVKTHMCLNEDTYIVVCGQIFDSLTHV
jgi:hypothetical protein